ncbi:hypothetical protein B0H14DRAFT_3756171 [Mycena olivaceomarginata]|nr:hypothetical protein B0H14DRAFT_3756171 [Mycena olivaceomarginata]
MATRSPSSASSSSSSNEHRISPDTLWDPVTIPDTFSRYSGFKYRVWFIWSIWYRYSVFWPLSLPWLAIICGSDGNGDLWLWEEEDEEGIREFAIGNEPLSVSQIGEDGNDAFQITEEDWNDAFQALEARFFPDNGSRQSVAGPLRKQTAIRAADIPGVAMLIYNWAQDWNEFMVEIPLKTWLQINNMTQIDNREWTSTDDDTPFRVAAVLLKYLPIPMAREKILPTLGIELEDYGIAFDIMACAVDRDYQNWSALANFDLEEFWTSASLEDWLSACDEALCHGVWHTPMPL